MINNESSILIARSIINLIDEIQLKLKKLNVNRDGINYLVLTELYSLRTRVYIRPLAKVVIASLFGLPVQQLS